MKKPGWNECRRCGLSYFSTYSEQHQNDCDRDLLKVGCQYSFPFFRRDSHELYTFMNRSISSENNKIPNVAENKLIFMNSLLAEKCGFKNGDILKLYIPRLNYTFCKSLCLMLSLKHISRVCLREYCFDKIIEANVNERIVINKINLSECATAESIVLKVISESELKFIEENYRQILSEIKKQYSDVIYSIGNQIFIVYSQKLLSFKVVQIGYFTFGEKLFKIEPETIWSIENISPNCSLKDNQYPIIGYESIVKKIKEIIMNFETQSQMIDINVLVHGIKGIGKSNICEHVKLYVEKMEQENSNLVLKEISKAIDENMIRDALYSEKKQIIIIDNLDKLISNKTDSKKSLIEDFFSEIDRKRRPILIFATAKEKMDNLDFDYSFELKRPNLLQRSSILELYLKECFTENSLITNNEIQEIASICNGFAPFDLRKVIKLAFNEISCMNSTLENRLLVEVLKNSIKHITSTSCDPIIKFKKPNVHWSDIGGQHDLKSKIMKSIILPLKYPKLFEKSGHRIQNGILMYGPPGCSKTMIAKAVATECNAFFIQVRLSKIVDKYVGESEKTISQIFSYAKENNPAIIYFDEIDNLGKERSNNEFSSGFEQRIVSQLLMEMDGFESRNKIFLLGSTNRIDVIDKALLRPGRFDTHIYVPLPNKTDRQEILDLYLKKCRQSIDIDFEYLAEVTNGFSCADLENLVRLAVEAQVYEYVTQINDNNEELKDDVLQTPLTFEHFQTALKECKNNSMLIKDEKEE